VCGAVAAGLLLFSAEHWTTAQQLGKTAIAAALAFVSIACLKPGR